MTCNNFQNYIITGLQNLWQPGSRAARKWKENEKMERKWNENEEMERDSLYTFPHFLSISSSFSHSLSIFSQPGCQAATSCVTLVREMISLYFHKIEVLDYILKFLCYFGIFICSCDFSICGEGGSRFLSESLRLNLRRLESH